MFNFVQQSVNHKFINVCEGVVEQNGLKKDMKRYLQWIPHVT